MWNEDVQESIQRKRYLQSTHVASHPTQSVSLEEAARTAENEDVHYNEIEFSKQRPSLGSAQDSTQQQDVVYSQVKECKTEQRLTQTSNRECVYSQVQKK